jgi:hypothetical protein
MHSVFCRREDWVATSGPRQDTAEENKICTRQQERGENKRPDALGILLERGVGGERSEKGCGQGESNLSTTDRGENDRPDTSMRSVFCRREEGVASDPRKDSA